jgi:hypothetical protein
MLDAAVAALPPGQEQIIGVFDLRQFELANADFQFAEFMIEAFFKYYPRRWVRVTEGLLIKDSAYTQQCVFLGGGGRGRMHLAAAAAP